MHKNRIYASALMISIILVSGITIFSRGEGSDDTREIPITPTVLSEPASVDISEHKESAEAGVRITAVYDANTSEIKLHLHTMSGSLDYDIKEISHP